MGTRVSVLVHYYLFSYCTFVIWYEEIALDWEDLGHAVRSFRKGLQEESEDSNKNSEFRRNFCHIIVASWWLNQSAYQKSLISSRVVSNDAGDV